MNFLQIILVSSVLIGFTSAKSSYLPNCPSDVEEIYFPHETDCSLYYVCSFGTLTTVTCPDGLHFNPTTNYCDYPANVGCELNGTTTTGIESTTVFTTVSTPDSTTGLWSTTDNPTYPTTTNNPTYPTTTNNPTYPTTTNNPTSPTEWPSTTMKPTCENSELPFIPHETDCNKFYVCVDGSPFLFICKDGLEFDYSSQKCVEISDSGCTASQS